MEGFRLTDPKNKHPKDDPMKKYSIVKIPVLPFNMVNAYLICCKQGCILLDTGTPGTERKIIPVLKKVGFDPSHIKLIVVTHAHMDHAGAAAAMRRHSNAPIAAHQHELRYLRGQDDISYRPTGVAGKIFQYTPLPNKAYERFTPDILIGENEKFSLEAFGFNATLMHTPGHTAGSISLEVDGGNAFVGDLLASGILIGGIMRLQRPIPPPFEDDPRAVAISLHHLIGNGNQTFFLGHGGPLNSGQVHKHIVNLEQKIKGCKSGFSL